MKSKSAMHFSNLIEMLQGDHIAGIRYIKSLNLGCNEMKYAVAGAACYYARMLRNDPARRDEFYKEALQVKWVRLHRSKLLLHVVMYLEDAPKKGNKYKLASTRRVALQRVCDDSEIPDEDIADYIKQHHGFKGLIQPDDEVLSDDDEAEVSSDNNTSGEGPHVASKLAAKSASIFSDDNEELDGTGGDVAQEPEGDDDAEVSRRPVRKTPKPSVPLKRLPPSYIQRCVLGRLSPAVREAFLQALRDGKPVRAKMVPGEIMDKYELYAGGGPFIEVTIDEYSAEA